MLLKTIKTATLLAAFFIITLTSPSCQNYEMKENIQKVDSLQNKLKLTGEMMDFDEEEIKNRADSISIKSNYITNNFSTYYDTVTHDLQMLTTKYRGIRKNYENFVKNYPILVFDHDKHVKRIADLRDDVLNNNISQQQFNKIYPNEKVLIQKHFERALALGESITKIDNDYKRTNEKITELYNDLKSREK